MKQMTIIKRLFTAKNYPIGSEERNKLNIDSETSEYMPSYKYVVKGENFSHTTKTKEDAQNFINNQH